jgi:two-component system sensor histidine kinase KdpD
MVLLHGLEEHLHQLMSRGGSASVRERMRATLLWDIPVALGVWLTAWGLVAIGFPSPESLSVLFVIPVLFSAVVHGLVASLIIGFLSVLVYDLILLSPQWDINALDVENITKMAVLSFVALIVSMLATQSRKLAQQVVQREHILSGVYALSQDMLGITNIEEMRKAAETKLSTLLNTHVRIMMAQECMEPNTAAQRCLKENIPVGRGTQHLPQEPFLYLPLASGKETIAVMHLAPGAEPFSFKILATLAAQTASGLEKTKLAEMREKELREASREKFLAALLASVTHDFKTPLVTVIGALSTLKDAAVIKNDSNYYETVLSGLGEAQKLNRFINNLVQISRLEAGLESIPMEPVSLRDILARSFKALQPLVGKQRFSIAAEPNFPFLNVNIGLMEMVFLNLLENALKYGPPEGEIKIIARNEQESVTIDIDDDGQGIPESEREAIFVKFYRSQYGDRKIAGTGLGLYICRSIVEAHGGAIKAVDPNDGQGACVRITLPKALLIPINIIPETEEL